MVLGHIFFSSNSGERASDNLHTVICKRNWALNLRLWHTSGLFHVNLDMLRPMCINNHQIDITFGKENSTMKCETCILIHNSEIHLKTRIQTRYFDAVHYWAERDWNTKSCQELKVITFFSSPRLEILM